MTFALALSENVSENLYSEVGFAILARYKARYKTMCFSHDGVIVQELCESRGGRPGLSVLTSLLVSVDVKNY